MNAYNLPNIIPAATVLSADRTSLAVQLENMFCYAIQITITGTPTGTFKLQMSNDPVPKANLKVGANGVITYAPTFWTDIANSSTAVSAAGSLYWNQTDVGYNYVRVVYSDGSSGGSTAIVTEATFNGKGA